MKRLLTGLAGILFFFSYSFGQDEVDALRYSQNHIIGTARSAAMAGAFGALGADFSALSTNPAGIGMYRSSEFIITPQLYFSNTGATYNGTYRDDVDENFNFSNLGMVLTEEIPNRLDKPGWRFMQFGVGINRLNNFNERIMIQGVNEQNSRADVYARLADGIPPGQLSDNPFDLEPAWNSFAIDLSDSVNNLYRSYAPEGPVNQKDFIESWGSMNEILISMGANYNDRLYVGASVGFPYIRYHQQRTYTETKTEESAVVDEFREYTVEEELFTTGTGFNFKVGAIYKPINWLRIGAAVHTPTYFTNLTDEWDISMETRFDLPDSQGNYDYYDSSPLGTFDYNLRTPLKAQGNLAFIIGTYGLFSIDYEYLDYATARFRAPRYDFETENQSIQNKYQATHNFRFGTEWRYTNFSFRGGFAIYQSPYANDINDGARTSLSFGVGYGFKNAFVDLAWVNTSSEEDYYMYGIKDAVEVNPAMIEKNKNRFLATIGFRF